MILVKIKIIFILLKIFCIFYLLFLIIKKIKFLMAGKYESLIMPDIVLQKSIQYGNTFNTLIVFLYIYII